MLDGGTWSIQCPACAPHPRTARRVRAQLYLGLCSGSPPCWSQHATYLQREIGSGSRTEDNLRDLVWVRCYTVSTSDFCLFGLHQLSHHGENVLASLRWNNEPFIKSANIKTIKFKMYTDVFIPNRCYFIIAVMYLGASICNIQVMQCDILDNLLLFVDITFGQRNILLCLQVKLCCKGVTAALSLQRHSNRKD